MEKVSTVAEIVASLPPIHVLLGDADEATAPVSSRSSRQIGLSRGSRRSLSQSRVRGAGQRSDAAVAAQRKVHQDRAAWQQIRRSLELPIINRDHSEVELAVAYLRRIPFYREASDDDLLAVAAQMEVVSVRGLNTEVGRVVPMARSSGGDGTHAGEVAGDHGDDAGKDGHAPRRVRRFVCTLGRGGGAMDDSQTSPMAMQALEADDTMMDLSALHRAPDASASPADCGSMFDSTAMGLRASSEAAVDKAGEETYDPYAKDVVCTLLEGKILLQLPTAAGKEHYLVRDGDTFGYGLLSGALPAGSQYVCDGDCLLLLVRSAASRGSMGPPVTAVVGRAEERILRRRVTFLTTMVTPQLFSIGGAPLPGAVHAGPGGAAEAAGIDVELCARMLVPLRLTDHQILAVEGEPSDALFLVQEGKLRVCRQVPLGRRGAPEPAPAARSRLRPSLRSDESVPNVIVMDVAVLGVGELCGELGLLGYNPDVRPGDGISWTDEYWEEALANRFRAPPTALDGTNAAFLKDLRTGDAADEPDDDGEPSPHPSSHMSEKDANDTAEMERELEKNARFAPVPAPRMATIVSIDSSVVLRFDYVACREVFSNHAVTRLREYAKGYPSVEDLRDRFQQQQGWELYKKQVVKDAIEEARRRR